MNWFNKKIKVVTHDGGFHPDETLGCAVLSIWADQNNYKLEITRTRDLRIIKQADIVLDVGMEYDPDKKRFDHHQKEGAGVRDNRVPYASFGLIWKHYGLEVCENNVEVSKLIEEKLVIPIDARDNGINISKVTDLGVVEYDFGEALSGFNLNWNEGIDQDNKQFFEALKFAKAVLEREIAGARAEVAGVRETEKIILDQETPEILILDKYVEWGKTVTKHKDIKIVVYPHKNKRDWCVQTGRDDLNDYNSARAKLPQSWWGLRDEELVQITCIPDAVFCAKGGWFGVAKTKAGALQMAKVSLQNSQN